MKIYIAAHKSLELPTQSPYQPLFVGAEKLGVAERRPDWEYDDSFIGNISRKNSTFCELTGLYWIWKRSREDIVGLVHYRRFLREPSGARGGGNLLSENTVRELLNKYDCIVAAHEPVVQGRFLISLAEQYRLAHSSTDLIQLRKVIGRYFSSYLTAFDSVMFDSAFSPYNILVCRKPLLNSYARWLFAVERKMEVRVDPFTDRDPYQQRVFGFLAERLFNVYLRKHRLSTYECSTVDPAAQDEPASDDISAAYIERPNFSITGLATPIDCGIDYSDVFDYSFYLNHYPDLAEHYFDNPEASLSHFLAYGIHEGRMAHPHFSIVSYINGCPLLRQEFSNNHVAYILHYLKHHDAREHATGYENLYCEGVHSDVAKPASLLQRHKKRMFKRFLQEAEREAVLD
ncbi:hypothetical protein Corgl_1119 [Coriobacterium glomerans PW2]|uniref:DUF4422 domain-containing protein n=1 Tax=Coriobacterium glomerans (strain ATCC 49209 / DSM 20642 / JCM 10262 / PW2) TaxID=700015 RepID=F2N842_CORGP|nr:DUF4422 domain-containing protein [Coriobacterium glomerans]AEB07225.1 hypothetical protein Corgl_1119 [Coriobacterium glomerans PW2]